MENKQQYNLKEKELANLLDALSHPARLQILEQLSSCPQCPAWAICDKLPICKSTVSRHMSKLKEAGFITCNPSGSCQNYKLNEERIDDLKRLVCDFMEQISNPNTNKNTCKNINFNDN